MRKACDVPDGSSRGVWAGLLGAVAIVLLVATFVLDPFVPDALLPIMCGAVASAFFLVGAAVILVAMHKNRREP